MEVADIAVPEGFTYSLVSDKPREDGPLYRFPAFGLLALGIGAVALGNARAAVDNLLELAGSKKPQGSRRTLAERGMSQSELAQAEAMLRSARAFYCEALGEAWQMANRGEEIGLEQRAALRLAATHATRTPRARQPTSCAGCTDSAAAPCCSRPTPCSAASATPTLQPST
jgi:alkylation response protein AidB-like acyl-CoA dehydrogenase